MMASLSSNPSRMHRGGSSDHGTGIRRPRLMRATATEPSITTSNVSRDALATQSGRRATELLSRVAYVSGSPPDSVLRSTPMSAARSPMFASVDRQGELSTSPLSQLDGFHDLHPPQQCSGRYFSFPSFDLYEAREQDEDKESETKTP
ncbi:hypothetical protein VTK26DRAFT_5917 [Humicola hyalothermophila]